VLIFIQLTLACNWRFLLCQGPHCHTDNDGTRFPNQLSIAHQVCTRYSGIIDGKFFNSQLGDLHGSGNGKAIFFSDSNCQNRIDIITVPDNDCFSDEILPPYPYSFQKVSGLFNGLYYDYHQYGYCCACGGNLQCRTGQIFRQCFVDCLEEKSIMNSTTSG